MPTPKTQGRYDGRRAARSPAQGLGRPPASVAVRTAVVAIDDPMEPGARLLATVNRRTDVLEDERSRGRISEAAYSVGRQLQEAWERASRLGSSSNWNEGGGGCSGPERHELTIGYAIRDAKRITETMRQVEAAVGEVGARVLRRIIGDRVTFAAYAASIGRGGKHGTTAVADRFRWLLEAVAEQFAARGPDHARIRAERLGDDET